MATQDARDRVITAASSEFAQYGIAGARVDRIAKAARTSKERVYAYFRSKEEIYDAVVSQELATALNAIELDPHDLPAYAGQLFDYASTYAERRRLVAWGRLELPPEALDADVITSKIELIRKAQRAGDLDPAWNPADVLAIVQQIAHTWVDQPEMTPVVRRLGIDPDDDERRAAVVRAVRQLFPPSNRG